MKKLNIIIPALVGILILAGAIVTYATRDLSDRITRAEEKIYIVQRDLDFKANSKEITIAMRNIEEKVKEIKDSNDGLAKEVKSLLLELNRVKWTKGGERNETP